MGELVLMGLIANAHGLDGAVKIKSFTERPADLAIYGPLRDRSGARHFMLSLIGEPKKDVVLARIAGVDDRTQAEQLKGEELFLERALLPKTEPDEFYLVDLIGLAVWDQNDRLIGKVSGIQEYGAGPILGILLDNQEELAVPFTKGFVPVIDLEKKRVQINRPVEIEADHD